jgi:hypothetical protein
MMIRTMMMTLLGKLEKAQSKSLMPLLVAAKESYPITGSNSQISSQKGSLKEMTM